MENTVKLEFTVAEINYILDCIGNGSIKAGKVLFDRIVAETQEQLAPKETPTEG
jgi:hypothetical protein